MPRPDAPRQGDLFLDALRQAIQPARPAPTGQATVVPASGIRAPAPALPHIVLNNIEVPYRLRRSRRKSIGLRISDDGLQVAAPTWVSQAEIERVLRERGDWIVKHLQAWASRQARLNLQRTRWEDGGRLPYLGVDIGFRLSGAGSTRYAGDAEQPTPDDIVWLGLPENAESARIRDSVQGWLQQRAQAVLAERLELALAHTGLSITGWRLSSAATRWGSCNSAGRILLNWRLVHFRRPIIDYVIIHELAHLREMNHGPGFWAEVEQFMPDYRIAREALRRVDPGSLPIF